jgi:hypothetical protein
MPVGVTLANLRVDLRAETGQSLNMAQNVQSQQSQDNQLDRQQRELWSAYDWPHLKYFVDIPVVAGQDVYDYPPNMPFDQINYVYFAMEDTTVWRPPLAYGLHGNFIRPNTPLIGTPMRWGNMVSVSDTGVTDPVGQIKIIPQPAMNGTLRFEGTAPCNPLVADDDTCILDSKAIVLFAATEILATQKVEAAQLKLLKAQNYLRRLLANQGADKRRNYNMGGKYNDGYLSSRPYQRWVPYIDYIPS